MLRSEPSRALAGRRVDHSSLVPRPAPFSVTRKLSVTFLCATKKVVGLGTRLRPQH